MNGEVSRDGLGAIEIEMVDGRVEAVRISNRWREHYDAAALGAKLSELVRGLLPERSLVQPQAVGETRLPVGLVPHFVAELRAGREAMQRYIARIRSGEVELRIPSVYHSDVDMHLQVTTHGGRFHAIQLEPKWAESAPLQALCDKILAALGAVVLNQPLERDHDLQDADRHYASARELLTVNGVAR